MKLMKIKSKKISKFSNMTLQNSQKVKIIIMKIILIMKKKKVK